MISKSLFVFCASFLTFSTAWENGYDEPVNFTCGANQYLFGVVSRHDDIHEDRQWEYVCTSVPSGTRLEFCLWYDNVNEYGGLLAFRCPEQHVITGVKSVHDNVHKDRTFGFRCCFLVKGSVQTCHITPFLNNYDGVMIYGVPIGKAIVGFYSAHLHPYGDRRWKADICSLRPKYRS